MAKKSTKHIYISHILFLFCQNCIAMKNTQTLCSLIFPHQQSWKENFSAYIIIRFLLFVCIIFIVMIMLSVWCVKMCAYRCVWERVQVKSFFLFYCFISHGLKLHFPCLSSTTTTTPIDKEIFNGSIVIDKRKYEFIVMLIATTNLQIIKRTSFCPVLYTSSWPNRYIVC